MSAATAGVPVDVQGWEATAFRPRRGPSRRPGPVRLVVRWFILLSLPFVVVTALSLGSELSRPGTMTTTERLIEWMRGHNGGPLVNQIERWYYTNHQPSVGGTLAALPTTQSSVQNTAGTGPRPIRPLVADPLPGEGEWRPLGGTVGGQPAIRVAYLRPDDIHTRLVAGVAWIDHRLTQVRLVPGRTQPGHGPWPGGTAIPVAEMPALLAAFNSGFRLEDSRGGFYLAGRTAGHLVAGAASLVVHTDGSATVEKWGRDETLSRSVVAVRQNLALIVDGGQLAPGIDNNAGDQWGKTLGNTVYVWRSGVGVDAAGNLIYAAGDGLNVRTLAELLRRAGAVRAMELDINQSWVTFNLFAHDASGGVVMASSMKLLPDMAKPATRYLTSDDRDFIAVLARS
jgi:hypothetical protein